MSKKKFAFRCKPSSFCPQKNCTPFCVLLIVSTGIIISVYFILHSLYVNGNFSLPFDDSFIHLTFAKNLSVHHSFSFYKDQMVTSGSSAPLYTILLAAGYSLLQDEFILSYLFGISFLLMLLIFYFKLCEKDFRFNIYFLTVAALILALDKWIVFFAVSGMETIFFILALIMSVFFYRTQKPFMLSASLGLLVLIRLEGVVLMFAIFLDYLISFLLSKNSPGKSSPKRFNSKQIIFIITILAVFAAIYVLINLSLSGTIFPNTFYAKKIFYSPEFMSREYFLKSEVLEFLTEGSYGILIFGFVISIVKLITNLSKGKADKTFVYFVFMFFYVFIYWKELPYAGLMGRYLVPLIPFYILLSVYGFYELLKTFRRFFKEDKMINIVSYGFVLVLIYFVSGDLSKNMNLYSSQCKYIYESRILPANWLKQNTDTSEVIATHEIGAIGFYSERKIIDIAGIVTPELINQLPDPEYISIMQKYLSKHNVQYLACLNNWCRVVNSAPVYSCKMIDLNSGVFEIYRYDTAHTHILSKEVNRLTVIAEYNLQKNQSSQALEFLNKAIRLDSNSSLSFVLNAEAYHKINDLKNYEINLLRASEIFPQYPGVNKKLAELYIRSKEYSKAAEFRRRYNNFRRSLNDGRVSETGNINYN